MAKNRYYAVRKGSKSNVIVDSWYECEALVKGVSGAIFKGFPNIILAEEFLDKKAVKWDKSKQVKKNKQGYTDTRILDAAEFTGVFIPATDKKDKYGFYKPAYYMKEGVRHANHGRTIGENYVPFTGDESVAPWNA